MSYIAHTEKIWFKAKIKKESITKSIDVPQLAKRKKKSKLNESIEHMRTQNEEKEGNSAMLVNACLPIEQIFCAIHSILAIYNINIFKKNRDY